MGHSLKPGDEKENPPQCIDCENASGKRGKGHRNLPAFAAPVGSVNFSACLAIDNEENNPQDAGDEQ